MSVVLGDWTKDLSDITLECLLLNISEDSNNWFINININWLSVAKYQMAKKENKSTKKEWFENKQYNTKRISKSNSPQKMAVNEELYIIQRELEEEEIIYQNHIKHASI